MARDCRSGHVAHPSSNARRGLALTKSSSGDAREKRAIAALKRGEIDALHYLYVRHVDQVQRVIQRVVRDHHAAEDIAQSVFMKLVSVIGRYEERDVPFVAWISRVARNAALDHVRARRQVPVAEVRTPDSTVGPIAAESSRTILEAMQRLPEDQRRVVMMRHVVGMTPSEIAKRLGRSEPSIHGLHHRGRATLQENLIELESAPSIAAPAGPGRSGEATTEAAVRLI